MIFLYMKLKSALQWKYDFFLIYNFWFLIVLFIVSFPYNVIGGEIEVCIGEIEIHKLLLFSGMYTGPNYMKTENCELNEKNK